MVSHVLNEGCIATREPGHFVGNIIDNVVCASRRRFLRRHDNGTASSFCAIERSGTLALEHVYMVDVVLLYLPQVVAADFLAVEQYQRLEHGTGRDHQRDGQDGHDVEQLAAHPRTGGRTTHHVDALHHAAAVEVVGEGQRRALHGLSGQQCLIGRQRNTLLQHVVVGLVLVHVAQALVEQIGHGVPPLQHFYNRQQQNVAGQQRIKEMLDYVELAEVVNENVRSLSGGMKRRLLIIRALIHRPQILFLDEPTVALDPQVRRKIWELIRQLKAQGVTIVLTTHYIEEAEQLCDRTAFLSYGKLIALDKPDNLCSIHNKCSLEEVFIKLTESNQNE